MEYNIIDLIEQWLKENKFPMELTEKRRDFIYYHKGFYWLFATYDDYSKCVIFEFGCNYVDDEEFGIEDELLVKIHDPAFFDKLKTFILPMQY